MLSVILNNPAEMAKKYQSSTEMLTSFVKNIYDNTHFEAIEINNKIYRELPNAWQYKNTRDENSITNEKLICQSDWYDGCTIKRKTIKPDTKYKFIIDYGSYSKKYLKKKIFSGNAILHIKNNDGYNTDHRGSDHFKYVIPYSDSARLINPTLKDLIDALYLVKSHKCDKWYELYIDTLFTIKKGKYVNEYNIILDFDHGS
jgi:hypothetical protein